MPTLSKGIEEKEYNKGCNKGEARINALNVILTIER